MLCVGDIVRVVKQPENQICHLINEVGLIEEILGDWCNIIALRLDGSANGYGSMPLGCLEIEHGLEWKLAKEYYYSQVAKHLKDSDDFNRMVEDGMREIAIKYGYRPDRLGVETIRSIYQEVGKLLP
jgi:hypothetical protein